MRVLFLGPHTSKIGKYLGCDRCELPLLGSDVIGLRLVSHGYRHILPAQVFKIAPAINCHISLLPWNRGASPNYWSWKEDAPKGVTIHEIDEGIDTGPILVQKEVLFGENETLKSSYDRLQDELLEMFIEHWPNFPPSKEQRGAGSYHSVSETPALDMSMRVDQL